MFRNSILRRFTPVLLVLAALASCSEQATESITSVGSVQADYVANNYTVIQERLPADLLPGVSLSNIIGIAGGSISLAGHVVTIPAGAVTVPTLFTMTVPLNGKVEVQLLATINTLLGVVNVGEKGFKKPVTLSLTYARATNVTDPSKLFIAYVPNGNYSQLEKLPSTLDANKKVVSANLLHFSKYCMASN